MEHDTTYDCEPTLNDGQVIEFCRKGFTVLEAVVPEDVNQRTLDYLADKTTGEPTDILREDWFQNHVIRNRQAAGAVRSLLGRDFHLPVLMSNHRRVCPFLNQMEWHIDGNYEHTHELNYLQVFYYPQDTPAELGPTEVLPGSHFLRNQHRFMGHLDNLRNMEKTAAPAGSIFITIYHIWHRGGFAPAEGLRHMLKYFYWRTTPPARDWIIDPDLDLSQTNFELDVPTMGEDFRGGARTAEMYYWLCGEHAKFQNLGGQSWPLLADRKGMPYGFPGSPAAAGS